MYDFRPEGLDQDSIVYLRDYPRGSARMKEEPLINLAATLEYNSLTCWVVSLVDCFVTYVRGK